MGRPLNPNLVREAFRDAVLAALDDAARAVFAGSAQLGRDPGASDDDLPALFAAIDAHAERLAARFGFDLEA